MKLAIGTAQFGLDYGIANLTGRVASEEVRNILKAGYLAGINTLDTAIGYGDSESELGSIGVQDWDVVSKLPALPIECVDVNNWVRGQVRESLARLKIPKLSGLLLHRPEELLGERGPYLMAALRNTQEDGLVGKIGVSIYAPEELDRLFQLYKFDLVQAPLNIFDRRIIDSGWALQFKKNNVELHTRSAFLQGLLLMSPENRPKKFNRWLPIWEAWADWLSRSQFSALEACLSYPSSQNLVSKVVIGVDSVKQLQEILSSLRPMPIDLPSWPMLIDPTLINPSQWHKL